MGGGMVVSLEGKGKGEGEGEEHWEGGEVEHQESEEAAYREETGYEEAKHREEIGYEKAQYHQNWHLFPSSSENNADIQMRHSNLVHHRPAFLQLAVYHPEQPGPHKVNSG